ncbi:MAG TPA: hypothetical protein PLC42_01030 [Parachlamydiaceae bacterium]|nr:hypothetical protein [Parachlamydiaceae bacterium]
MKKTLFSLFFFLICLNLLEAKNGGSAKLEAQIELLPSKLSQGNLEAISPGSPLIISAKIKNTGTKYNEKGYFFVRFSGMNNKNAYTSEKIALPSIAPQKEAFIIFKTPHITPSLQDFVQQRYGDYPYQVVVVIDSKEYIIGTANLQFSAYYFSGPSQKIATDVPSLEE